MNRRYRREKKKRQYYLNTNHYPSFNDYNNSEIEGRIINESQADDLYSIMAAMDAYITDYSSACFEAEFARMPVFIYADDIDQYRRDRGEIFWNISENTKKRH